MTAQQLTMSSPESAELLNKVTDKLILSTIHYQLKIPGLDFPTSPIAPPVDSHNHSTDTPQNNSVIEGSENLLEKNVWLQHNHPLEDSDLGWVSLQLMSVITLIFLYIDFCHRAGSPLVRLHQRHLERKEADQGLPSNLWRSHDRHCLRPHGIVCSSSCI